ncbi:MAG: S-layer homology domain-containing protein [Oscillospiraceae bacterium]
MKKIVSIILCVALCFTLGTAVFAEPTTTPGTTTPGTTTPSTTTPGTTTPGTTTPGTTKPADNGFADVPADYVHYDEIMYVNGEGWMLGFRNNTFRPTAGMTRAMLANVVYRMMNGDASGLADVDFIDADTIHADYMDGVKYCVANKLMLGYRDDTFRPNEVLTRAQFVTVLCRMNDGKATSDDAAKVFKDFDTIAKDYIDAVNWAVENKLVQGYDDGNFLPNAPLTRQIFCVLLYRVNVEPITTPVTSPVTSSTTDPSTSVVTTPVTTPVTSSTTDPSTSTVTEPVTEPAAG